MLSFSHVSLCKETTLVLDDVSFTVAPGEFLCIVGGSGSGKTSILKLLLGLEKPSKGNVCVDDMDIALLPPKFLQVYRRSIGYLPQENLLLADKTVAASIALPLRIRGVRRKELEERLAAVLLRMDLMKKAAFLPEALTLCERRKAALARAVIGEPSILLVDEPTAALEGEHARSILSILRERNHRGATVFLATSDATLAERLGTQVLRLERGKLLPRTTSTRTPPREMHAPRSRTRIIPVTV